MNTQKRFHLVYRPSDERGHEQEQIVDLIESEDPEDVILQLRAAPELVALELDAEDLHEAAIELRDLGFSW